MNGKNFDEVLKEFYKGMPKDGVKELKDSGFDEQLKNMLENQTKDLNDDERKHMLNKITTSLKQNAKGYTISDVNEKYVDKFMRADSYIIKMDSEEENMSLDAILNRCSVEQLNLYNAFYNHIAGIYKVKKVTEKSRDITIENLKMDIIINFKQYVSKARKMDIFFFNKALKNNGILDEVDTELVSRGFFVPYKVKKRKVKYIVAKEILDIFSKVDFSVTSQATKDEVKSLLSYFVISKGVVSKDEIEEFILDVADFNIKSEELFELVNNTESLIKQDDYYYIDKLIDKKLFNKLVKIKEENPYMPTVDEVLSLRIVMEDFLKLIVDINGELPNTHKLIKTLLYKPVEVEVLVGKIMKVLKIDEKFEDDLLEFFFEYRYLLLYWVNNGEGEDEEEDLMNFLENFNIDEIEKLINSDSDLSDIDLPF